MHHRVGLRSGQESGEQGAADVGLDEIGPLELDRGRGRVDPRQIIDGGISLQPACELGAPMARDADDDDASASH